MKYLYLILLAISPISELRGAIPFGLTFSEIPLYLVLILAVLGNMAPVFLILWLLPIVSQFLAQRFDFFNKFFDLLFNWQRKKHKKKFELYKELALVILVAIPLPLTGAWTGALVAFIFGVPYKKAVPLIFLGVLIAALLVTLATLGIIKIANVSI